MIFESCCAPVIPCQATFLPPFEMLHYDMRDSCRISCVSFSLGNIRYRGGSFMRIKVFVCWFSYALSYAVRLCNVNDVEKSPVDSNINVIMNDMLTIFQLVDACTLQLATLFAHTANLWLAKWISAWFFLRTLPRFNVKVASIFTVFPG